VLKSDRDLIDKSNIYLRITEGVSDMWWTWQVYDLYQKELQEKMGKKSSK